MENSNKSIFVKDVVRWRMLFTKDRVLDFRGLKALWSAPILMNAIVIQHNFVEAHTTINEVPCEKAGVNLGLGENRWLDLIRLSSKHAKS